MKEAAAGPSTHVTPLSTLTCQAAPLASCRPVTATVPSLLTPSLAESPVSLTSAKAGVASGITGPKVVDQAPAPTAFTARTRTRTCVPLTSPVTSAVGAAGTAWIAPGKAPVEVVSIS